MTAPLMTSNVHGQGGVFNRARGPAPSASPNGGDPQDAPHNIAGCAPLKYRGMHGAPCNLNLSGANADNTICPFGTVPGLWWRFNVPGLGNVYYVDCCGRHITWTVWCRWAKEPNWCAGKGNNVYTCTLTVLQRDMKVGPNGFADEAKFSPRPLGP